MTKFVQDQRLYKVLAVYNHVGGIDENPAAGDLKKMKPTSDNPRYVQGKKGEDFTYYKEWYEGDKRRRKTISDKDYFQYLKDNSPAEEVPKTEMKAPKAKKAVKPKVEAKPKAKATVERCGRGQHDWTAEDEGGWQTCKICGGRRRLRGDGPWKAGQARYTYRW